MPLVLHGDNLEVMRAEVTDLAPVDLVYLDPPFNTGRDFFLGEELAYSDRWPSVEAYVAHLRERVAAARDLLAAHGSLVLHCDKRSSYDLKPMLDGVFGRACFSDEIIWRYRRMPTPQRRFQPMHDVLLRYVRDASVEPRWTQLYEPLSPKTLKAHGTAKNRSVWRDGKRLFVDRDPTDESPGAAMGDVWDVSVLNMMAKERTGYPTQKPEELLARLISATTLPRDLVLDPYCGSGTTLAAAHRLGRGAVGIDASPVAVRVARERLGLS